MSKKKKTVAGSTRLAEEGSCLSASRSPSFPVGKDEPQQLTQVRKAWTEYQAKEKEFSKEFALALIALHKELAKPGSGSFVKNLENLKIPHTTAYRLMQLHGWKPTKRKAENPKMSEAEITRIAKDQAVTKALGYFGRFEGETLREKYEQFCEELRRELFAELA